MVASSLAKPSSFPMSPQDGRGAGALLQEEEEEEEAEAVTQALEEQVFRWVPEASQSGSLTQQKCWTKPGHWVD